MICMHKCMLFIQYSVHKQQARKLRNCDPIRSRVKIFSIFQSIHTSSTAHPAFCSMGTVSSFLRGKAAMVWTSPPTPYTVKVRNEWNYNCTSPYTFMQCTWKSLSLCWMYILVLWSNSSKPDTKNIPYVLRAPRGWLQMLWCLARISFTCTTSKVSAITTLWEFYIQLARLPYKVLWYLI